MATPTPSAPIKGLPPPLRRPASSSPPSTRASSPGATGGERTPLLRRRRGDDEEGPRAKVLKASLAVIVAAGFMAASSAMVLFNKTLMHPDHFPFPAFLTSLHMLGSFLLALGLRAVAPSMFPSSDAVFGGNRPSADPELAVGEAKKPEADALRVLERFVPIGICSAISLVAGNWAYRYAPVTFLQTIKEGQIGLVYMMAVILGTEEFQWRSVAILTFTACCSMFAVYHQTEPSLAGFGLQMVCGLAISTQAALMSRIMGSFGGVRLDPLTVVLCLAPTTFLALVPINCMMWDARIPGHLLANWHALLANVLLAFTLQVMGAVSLKVLNSVGQGLVSTLKDMLVVLAASRALHEQISRPQLLGFVGAVCGVGLYSATKLFPDGFCSHGRGGKA